MPSQRELERERCARVAEVYERMYLKRAKDAAAEGVSLMRNIENGHAGVAQSIAAAIRRLDDEPDALEELLGENDA